MPNKADILAQSDNTISDDSSFASEQERAGSDSHVLREKMGSDYLASVVWEVGDEGLDMSSTANKRVWGLGGRSSVFVAAIVFIFSILGLVLLSRDVVHKIDSLATATSDNVQWTLFQLEVDMMSLTVALERADSGAGAELNEIRKYFDLFFSRYDSVRNSPTYSPLHESPGGLERLERLDQYIEETVPLIDSSDELLRAGIPELRRATSAIGQDVRQLSVSAIGVFSANANTEREEVAITLIRIATATGILILIMAALLLGMARLLRENEKHAYAMRNSTDRLQTIIATALDAVVVADEDGMVLAFNGSATELYRQTRNELEGLNLCDLIGDEASRGGVFARSNNCNEYLRNLLGPQQPGVMRRRRIRLSGLRPDGSSFPAEVSLAEADSGGTIIIVAFIRDISASLAAETALMEARDEALVAARAKAEFLAVMSHEMRTPLGGLLGTLEILRDSNLTAKQREWLDMMEASGRILRDHVNDVLDIAKLEAGKVALDPEPVYLGRLIEELASSQRSLAARNGNRLVVKVPQPEPGPLQGDAARMRQVLLNLLGNAIKFTREGRIEIGYQLLNPGQEDDPDRVELQIYVSDTGIGIPKDKQTGIFEDFVTLDSAYDRANSGTGLGLGIVRRLVQVMGGEIHVDSVENVGSRFIITMQFERATPSMIQAAEGREQEKLQLDADQKTTHEKFKILLVEDNPINRNVARHHITALGHEVVEAEDGIVASLLASEERFDLILMDISMPRQDGITTTRQIRSGDGPSRDTPIVALTAHAFPEEVESFYQAGMQSCLTKPVSRAELSQKLQQVANPAMVVPLFPRTTEPASSNAERDQFSDYPLIDAHHLDEMVCDLGEETFIKLRDAALSDGDELVELLQKRALSKEAGEIAHRLAGTAASFGATRLQMMISSVEAELRSGDANPEKRRQIIDAISGLWKDVVDLLSEDEEDAEPLISSINASEETSA